MAESRICIPGQRLCSASDGNESGAGTFVMNGFIYSSLAGYLTRSTNKEGLSLVEVKTTLDQGVIPYVGCIVTAKVTRVTPRFCRASMLAVNNTLLREPFSGILRKEDVRAKEKDQVQMHKCFRPGDIILARVLSLGDALSYVLTTAENELGVVVATSEAGSQLIPISWCEMQCPKTFAKEFRKVARIQSKHIQQPKLSVR